MYYYIHTYGCQMNENDSENIAGQLRELGYEGCAHPAEADCIVINTCCVRESAEKKINGKIGELKRYKQDNPRLVTVITGCMAQKNAVSLLKKYPYVDIVLGPQRLEYIGEALAAVASGERVNHTGEEPLRFSRTHTPVRNRNISAYIPIMHGCNNFCSYCIVPYVRGREISRPSTEIVAEISEAAARGCKEFTLLGQNVNSYRGDYGNTDFAALLEKVDDIPGVERIRYMTSHPRDMNEQLIQVIGNSRTITSHFHLPVQAGDDTILSEMNRGYTASTYLALLDCVRRYIPGATVTTDIIVGFPGETAEMFANTLKLVERARFDQAYTFIYSQRSGTPAATKANQVPLPEKKQRLAQLMQLQDRISLEKNTACIGNVYRVMAEGESKTNPAVWSGRTEGNKIVLWPHRGETCPGDIVTVKITAAQTWLLKGELV